MTAYTSALLGFVAGYCAAGLVISCCEVLLSSARSLSAPPATTADQDGLEAPRSAPPTPHLRAPNQILPLPTYDLSGTPYLAEAFEVLRRLRETGDTRLPIVLSWLRAMNAYAFEELLCFCFYERGYKGRTTGRYSHDGGIDGWATIGDRPAIIQAKRWKRHICNRDISALAAVARENNALGLFVHTGRTGKLARRIARANGVIVISGQALVDLVLGRPVPTPALGVLLCSSALDNAGAVLDAVFDPREPDLALGRVHSTVVAASAQAAPGVR